MAAFGSMVNAATDGGVVEAKFVGAKGNKVKMKFPADYNGIHAHDHKSNGFVWVRKSQIV